MIITEAKLVSMLNRVFHNRKTGYFLIAIIGLVVFSWFETGATYFGGDLMFPLNPSWELNHVFYLWRGESGGIPEWHTGSYIWYLSFYILTKAGLPIWIAQRVIFYFIFILPGLSMYYLVSVILPKNKNNNRKHFACLLAALFYMFNPAILNFQDFLIYPPYAVAPLILGLFIKSINEDLKGKIKLGLIVSIAYFGFLAVKLNYAPDLILLFMILVYSVGYIIVEKKVKPILSTCTVFISLILLINAPIVWEYYVFISHRGSSSLAAAPPQFQTFFPDFYGSTRFTHDFVGNRTFPYYFTLGETFLYSVNFFFVIFIFSTLLSNRKSKITLYFAFLSLACVLISAGVHSPFGGIYGWMVTCIPFLRPFRDTIYLHSFVALCYSVLLGIAIYKLCKKIQFKQKFVRALLFIFLISLILINGWPLVIGAPFHVTDVEGAWVNNAGHKIPQSYYNVNQWVNQQENSLDHRVLTYPPPLGPLTQFATWDNSRVNPVFGVEYAGVNVAPHIISKPFIWEENAGYAGDFPIVKKVFDYSRNDSSAMIKLAGVLNVRYILLDGYEVRRYSLPALVAELDYLEDDWTETSPSILSEDNQTGFWTPVASGDGSVGFPVLIDDDSTKVSGKNSLRITCGSGHYYAWGIYHEYAEIQNWDDKKYFSFYWYGDGSGNELQIKVVNDNNSNLFLKYTTVNWDGWGRIVVPLREFIAEGLPSWESVKFIGIFSQTGNWQGTWHIDRVLFDIDPGSLSGKKYIENYGEAVWTDSNFLVGKCVWSMYYGDGSISSDGVIGTLNNTGASESLSIAHRPISVELNTSYLAVRVKGDINTKFRILFKDENDEAVYVSGEIDSPPCFTTFLFFIKNIDLQKVRYIDLQNIKFTDNDASLYFDYILFGTETFFDDLWQSMGAEKVASFDKLNIYEIDNKHVLPHIYATDRIHLVDGDIDQITQFLKNDNFVLDNSVLFLSEQQKSVQWQFLEEYAQENTIQPQIVSLCAVNPTEFKVHLNASQPFFLVLSEAYNAQWKVYIGDVSWFGALWRSPIPSEYHFTGNGYANVWYLNPEEIDGDEFTLTIYYWPQSFFYMGYIISGLTFLSCISYLIYQKCKNKKWWRVLFRNIFKFYA